MMLAWLTIAPLGRPVVPLVYTSVARLPGATASARASNRSGSRSQTRRADRAQLREAEHERVIETIVVVEHDDPVELRQLVPHFEDPGRELVVLDEAHVRFAVAEDVRDLFGRAGLVHGHGDAAVGEDPEVGEVPLGAIVREDPDVLARLRCRARRGRR